MDSINFLNYLKNPGYLHQVTFQELNNLIEQYPFCQNLHYLALRKAQNEDHKDFVKKLELAATYSPDRQWLYRQLQDDVQSPGAVSDLTEDDREVQEEDYSKEPRSTVTIITDERPVPSSAEEEPSFVEEYHEKEYEEEEYEENPLSEELPDQQPFASVDPNPMASHSITDSDLSMEALEDLSKNLEANLEELEEAPPQEQKKHKVLYMEDLVEEIPPSNERTSEVIPPEEENTSDDAGYSEQPVAEQAIEAPTDSAPPEDNLPEVSNSQEIPFEIYTSATDKIYEEEVTKIETIEEETIEEESTEDEIIEEEVEEIPSIEYVEPVEDLPEKVDPEFDIENTPLVFMKQEEQEEQEDSSVAPPENIELERENIITSPSPEEEEVSEAEEQAAAEKDTEEKSSAVTPKPKTAFSSWAKASKPVLEPQKKKKPTKKKSEVRTVYEVTNLFKDNKDTTEEKEEKTKKKKDKKKKDKKQAKDKEKPLILKEKEKKEKKKKKKKKKKERTKTYAMESLLEHDDVISETLAELLAGQGSRKKATRMYKRLIEIYPEKEAIYTKRIKELNEPK